MEKYCDLFCAILIIINLSSCSNQLETQHNNYSKEIMGKWILTKNQINYPSLEFNQDSTAIFTSMGDTIYRYNFYVDKNNLILKDINGVISIDKILKLNKDSLILETLANKKEIQRYKRQ